MGYIASATRISSLTVGGVDYTSAFTDWQVSDDSAYNNGCIKTQGTLLLGSYPGGPLIEDYDRNNFKRGVEVILDMRQPDGTIYRHPRGLLYVVATSYDVESEALEVDLGCRLSLMALTEKIDDLIALVPVQLDVAQTTFSNCSAAFASLGQYVYQDNNGVLQTGTFFDGDNYESVAAGEWVSILGVTAVSVSPLAGAEAIPDQIRLSYQVPSDGIPGDGRGRVDEVLSESYYFLKYPASMFERVGFLGSGGGFPGTPGNPGNPGNDGNDGAPGSSDPNNPSNQNDGNGNPPLGNVGNVSTGNPAGPGNTSSCGNAPSAPLGNPYG